MMIKFIFVWFFSYLFLKVDASQCNFNVSQIYNVTDLLHCMNELAVDFFAQSNSRSLRQSSQSDSVYKEKPHELSYVSLISNLLENVALSTHHDSPLNPAAGHYQLNRPGTSDESSGPLAGLGMNLFDALSSISRYDDFKCVPRILCEATSGKLPTEYKQAPTYLSDFQGNLFTRWLAGVDVTKMSPLLNFARATVLGYSSRGDPAACYRAYPRCPRNPDKLVYYLNNHNGGFFRFFNRHGRENHQQTKSLYALQGDTVLLKGGKRKALPPGYAGAEADRTGTGKLKFDTLVLSARQNDEKSFFPKENIPTSSGRVVFPTHEALNEHSSGNRTPKLLSESENSDTNAPSSFFPQESDNQSVRVLRFTPQLLDSVLRSTFRFPHS